MPGITVSKTEFLKCLQRQWNDTEVDNVLFDFGLELDEIDEIEGTYKIDVPANRYDLLCLRGLVNGVGAYIGQSSQKSLEIKEAKDLVGGERPVSRPFVKMVMLKNIDLRNGGYQDLIDFQDKLHQGLGQNRVLMAIGTHDLDKTVGPFKYTAWPESEVKFVPLNQTKEYTRPELDDLYKSDPKLKAYLGLARENGQVPVILDGQDRILSLPPLINSDFSKISEQTTNMLIEITGTDKPRVCTAMYLLLHHFSGPGSEIVEIPGGVEEVLRTPLTLTQSEIKTELHTELSAEVAAKALRQMLHQVEIVPGESEWSLVVTPSRLRPDILHTCDLIEDIAIAYGYNRIERVLSTEYTIGKELPINKLARSLRQECAYAGFTEVFTMALHSKHDMHGFGLDKHIQVKNPKSTECEVLRQSLAPSVLKCIFSNQHHHLPICLFEVSDVGLFTADDVGVRNDKRMCMASAGSSSRLEDLQEAFEVVMRRMGFVVQYVPEDLPQFIEGRSCAIYFNGQNIGGLGIIKPAISLHHKIPHVCSLVEISLTMLSSLIPATYPN
ncbi:phenylalanyl-tRNA synthetase beta chain [Nematocida homosporus]|uniref:phenylalanyl-tRNA synthetase beta chain n=1 Tax=Nematocida homosporus TaxID=1912981 RepID=UPI00222016D4|nr:phenylalanyl-tRNA synthetase beta chain [Nematocida homosporus]KAI5186655.1 phenylalanyl-tRNA synthetase beta chain [Nematocida homosporus]